MENVSHNTSYDSADNLSRDPNQQAFDEQQYEMESGHRGQSNQMGQRSNWGSSYTQVIHEVIPEYPEVEQSAMETGHRRVPSNLHEVPQGDPSHVPDSQDSREYRQALRNNYSSGMQIEEEDEESQEAPPARERGQFFHQVDSDDQDDPERLGLMNPNMLKAPNQNNIIHDNPAQREEFMQRQNQQALTQQLGAVEFPRQQMVSEPAQSRIELQDSNLPRESEVSMSQASQSQRSQRSQKRSAFLNPVNASDKGSKVTDKQSQKSNSIIASIKSQQQSRARSKQSNQPTESREAASSVQSYQKQEIQQEYAEYAPIQESVNEIYSSMTTGKEELTSSKYVGSNDFGAQPTNQQQSAQVAQAVPQQDLFPTSTPLSEENKEDEQTKALRSTMAAKAIQRWITRRQSRTQYQRLQIKHAFTKLILHRQEGQLEQLITDNENLIEQIQNLRTQTENGSEANPSVTVVQEDVYNINQQRDQIGERNAHHSLLGLSPERSDYNRSDKDMSPSLIVGQAPKGSAFMRAIDEPTLQTMIPQVKQDSILTDKMFGTQRDQTSQSSFFDEMSKKLKELISLCQSSQDISAIPTVSQQLTLYATKFDSEVQKIRLQCTQVQQLKQMLATKVNSYEKMEIDSLELHLQLDAKLRALESVIKCGDPSKLFSFNHSQKKDGETQTAVSINEILKKETNLKLLEKELELVQQRQSEDFAVKESGLVKRERDLEIRERLIEEKRIEYSYKQKELNQRIKSQMTWPLNCLENDTKLLEKFKDFKLKPDHLKTLEADSNLSTFLQREENLQLMKNLSGDLLSKCEGLLHYEYLLLKERAKNIILAEHLQQEISTVQQESEELARDREKYGLSVDYERMLQEDAERNDKNRFELLSIQDGLQKLLDQSRKIFQRELILQGMSDGRSTPYSENVMTPDTSSMYNQQKPNPYQQTINAKNGVALMQVIDQFRDQEQKTKWRNLDLQNLVEQTLQMLQTNSGIKGEDTNASHNAVSQRQIRRMLVRDAYFLQKERQWLDQERQKLSSILKGGRPTRAASTGVQTSTIIKHSENSRGDQRAIEIVEPKRGSSQERPMTHAKHSREPSSNMQDSSLISTMEQDRKKIQLLQQNLTLEKEYNKDLNQQLAMQMERIKIQNEKLIESENSVNEMKLRMLIKFEQIKMLEDFYNIHHSDQPEQQVNLEVELDQEQIRLIAKQIYLQEQGKVRSYRFSRVKNGVEAVLRYLLMEKCRHATSRLRKRYAFALFRAATRSPDDQAVVQQTSILSVTNSPLGELGDNLNQSNLSVHNRSGSRRLSRAEEIATADKQMDWYDLFWAKHRQELSIDAFRYKSGEQLYTIAKNLEQDRANFFRFRATNTIRLMLMHSRRRQRLLLYFAFQKYKVQSMRSTVNQLMQVKIQQSNAEMLESTTKLINDDESEHKPDDVRSFSARSHERHLGSQEGDTHPIEQPYAGVLPKQEITYIQPTKLELNAAKKQALILMLTLSNEKYGNLREKNRALNKWREICRAQEAFATHLELARLNKEVETVKFQEQLLRTNFEVQKTELESKINLLVSLIN